MTKVWASDIYYSDYGSFSAYQEEKIEENDMIEVEKVTMYKWYKWVKVPGEFKLYNSIDNFTDNCYETEYSNWSLTKPMISESTILEEKTTYNYQIIEPIRYVHLYNLSGSYAAFRIPELEIYINDEQIDYTYTCDGCWDNFDKYINNGIYAENNSYIDNGGSLIIDLGKEYPINQVKVVFYIFDMGQSDKNYTIGYSKNGNDIFISKSYKQQFSLVYLKDAKRFEYEVTDLNISSDLWLESKISDEYLDNEYVYSMTSYKEYRYKEKMCETYTFSKEYYPQYSLTSVMDYNLNDSSKEFYRYKKRDKLELNIYDITEKNYDLNKFVIYSSDDYSIENNIDWNKNGLYKINFTLNNLNVSKDVKVMILENSLKEKEEEINDLKNQLENTISDYEKIITSLEKSNYDYLTSLNDLNLQIIELNKRLENLKNYNTDQDELIEDLQNELNLRLNEYEEKIHNLEKINQTYLENLNILSNTIYDLEAMINTLKTNQQSNNLEINDLKEQLEQYIKEYDEKINYLQNFNNDYTLKLIDINSNIQIMNETLNNLEQTGISIDI